MTPSPLFPALPSQSSASLRASGSKLQASLLAAISCALLCASPLSATSVTLQGGFGYPNAKDSSGNPVATGHKVSIGTFPDTFDPATADLPTLLANWHEFGFTTTAVLLGDPGSFWLQASHPTGIDPQGFSYPGKKIYLLLTRTDAAYSEPAADASNVRDFALFTSTHAAWTFRNPPSGSNLSPGDLSELNTSQITSAIAGTADPATGTFALASYSTGDSTSDGSTSSAFDQWIAATFGENSTVAAEDQVGPAGLTALATFALNSTPEATTPPYTTVTDPDTGRVGIEFTRKKASASGFATFAQACTTLADWSLPVTESIVASTDTTETVRAYPDFPADSDQSKAFFRIRVEPAN